MSDTPSSLFLILILPFYLEFLELVLGGGNWPGVPFGLHGLALRHQDLDLGLKLGLLLAHGRLLVVDFVAARAGHLGGLGELAALSGRGLMFTR